MHEADYQLRIDPHITDADKRVTPSEIAAFGDVPEDRPTGEGMTVAIRDSGMDPSHPVFADADVEVHDFTGRGEGDEVGHGTAVAGLIHLLAPDANLVMLRIFGGSGQADISAVTESYQWLMDNAARVDFVNDSWGATRRVQLLDNLQNRIIDAGVRDVTAAGNTGDKGGSPATATKSWGVGALTIEGEVTRFSSYNPDRDNPDTAQVGKNVLLPRAVGTSMGRVVTDHEWPAVVASGTSFSAPIQAGMAASWASKHEWATESMAAFEHTAADIPGTPEDGEGKAVLGPALDYVPEDAGLADARVWSLPWGSEDFVHIDADVLEDGRYGVDKQRLGAAFRRK